MSEDMVEVTLPLDSYKPLSELDEWRIAAEKREQEKLDAVLASRVKCSTDGCEELATTWVYKLDEVGEVLDGSAEYVACWEHARSSGPCMTNNYGFLPDGSTWSEGFIKLGPPS